MHIHRRILHHPNQKLRRPNSGRHREIQNIQSQQKYTHSKKTTWTPKYPYSRIEILIAIQTIQTTTQIDTHIFTDSLNIYLINNHIQHSTSQQPHSDKLLIVAIIHQIYWTPHLIHIYKVRAHTNIIGNEIADTLANEGALKEKPAATPHIHISHATP